MKCDIIDKGTKYIDLLSRGGLTIPSNHACKCFAMFDVAKDQLCLHVPKRSGMQQKMFKTTWS